MATAQQLGDFWHGTSTAVVPTSPEPFELKPAAAHRQARVWGARAEVNAPARYAYVGDLIALAFAMVAAHELGGDPVLIVVRLHADDLAPDPSYLDVVNPPPEHRGWRSSYIACGRVATTATAQPHYRGRCSDVRALARALEHFGLGTQVSRWADPTSHLAKAREHGFPEESLGFRQAAGERIWRSLFEKF